jgi:hypothetical protein
MRWRKDKHVVPHDRRISERVNTLLNPLLNLGCARAKPIGRKVEYGCFECVARIGVRKRASVTYRP